MKVIHSLVEWRDVGGRIRKAGAAFVPHYEPGDLRQLFGDGCDRARGFVDRSTLLNQPGFHTSVVSPSPNSRYASRTEPLRA